MVKEVRYILATQRGGESTSKEITMGVSTNKGEKGGRNVLRVYRALK